MSDYWIPKYKYQVVEWLSNHYKEPKSRYNRWSTKRVYKVYKKARELLKKM